MFRGATNFNSPIEHWDVSNVTNMRELFGWPGESSAFDQPLNGWNVSNVTDMEWMFFGTPFNQPLDSWDVSSVTNMNYMFNSMPNFNQPLNTWDVSSVTTMISMFGGASDFNQPLNNWNTSNVTNMNDVFFIAPSFNQPLNTWDVSSVTTMNRMFGGATSFNQPLNSWNVSGVTDMGSMFEDAANFNQSLNTWDVSSVVNMENMLDGTALTPANYSGLLNSWSLLSLQNDVILGASGLVYTDTATTARQFLIDTYNWTISGDSPYVAPSPETFITRWDTTLDPSTQNSLSIYTFNSATAFTIDWGDGTTQYFAAGQDDYVTHTYSIPGIKTVTITGTFPYFYAGCYDGNEYNKLIDVVQWGTGQWESFVGSFAGCTYLEEFSATDVPDLSQVTDMSEAFSDATSFNGDIGDWNVSNVTEMIYMFNDATSFNGDISDWNVSNVNNMYSIFAGATSFNQDLSTWNVSSIGFTTAIPGMFAGATMFSTSNYTKLLLGWSSQTLSDGYIGHIGGTYDNDLGDYINLTPYCTLAQGARDIMTDIYNLDITDGGPVPCQTATYTAGENGTLTGDTFQYIPDGQSGTAITAVPAEGYRFVSWSDGSTANPRTDSNLTGTLAVTAVFSLSSGNNQESTKVGERAKQLTEAIKTMPVVGSIATFAASVRDFLAYLTANEDTLETLTPQERTTIIIALRDILAFLLKMVPGV